MRPTTQTLFTRRIFHGALFSAIILAVCWPLYLYLHPDLRDLDDFDALKKKPEAEQRSFLHRVLKNPRGNHHDAFGMLQLVGDETSVPIILKVLKRYAPSGEFSMCLEQNAAEALRDITNNMPGDTCMAWEAWWEKHSSESRETWILNGFREAGLPVAAPPDEPFVRALISTLAIDTVCPGKTYLIFNAYRLLVSMPEDLVASCAEGCANSPDKQARLGSIVWLGETDYPQRWTGPTLPRKYQANEADMLRAMTSDPDTDVRTAALSKLNTHIRTTISEDSDSYIIWKGTLGEEITAIGAGCDKSHLVIGVTAPTPTKRGFALLSFNLDSKKADWVFSSSGAVNCTPQTTEDSIFFTSYDGTVYCADSTTGKAIWRRQVEGSQGWRAQNRILLVEHMVVVAAARCLWALDQATGDVLWNMEMNPKGKDQPSLSDCVAYASGYLFAPLCGDRVVKISSFGQVVAERDLGGATVHQLVSGSDRVYTITSIEYSATLSALSASDLTPLWKTEVAQAISVCETRGITDTIIVAVSDHTIALDAATGKPLWRVKEFGQFSNIMGTVDDCLIIEDPFFRLQIRHVDNGEIRLVYPAALYATSSVYTQGNIVAAGDSYGTLWLLRVPEGL